MGTGTADLFSTMEYTSVPKRAVKTAEFEECSGFSMVRWVKVSFF